VCVRVHIYITSGMGSKGSAVTAPHVETIHIRIYIYIYMCVCVCMSRYIGKCVCVCTCI